MFRANDRCLRKIRFAVGTAWAVVTGTSSGIGRAIAIVLDDGLNRELAPHGIDVLASAPGPTTSGFAERTRMKMGSAMSPEIVASETVRALGRRSNVLPGGRSKLLGYSPATLPRWIRTRIMGSVKHGMTKQ
ncbi:MAG: hypothetical protein H7Z17_15370 [Fuerstia sp.]|nr:hypothetical protein [Fuerstiella sp.]